MTPKDAGAEVRAWIERHTRAVLNALACAGVPPADRPDLAQDVFLTAYGILLRSLVPVDHPRAWLCAIATRRASDYRRAAGRRLCLTSTDDAPSDVADPEQGAEHREFVTLVLEPLGEEARGVLLDRRAEGLSWDEVAHERGLTVPRAKYIYRVAVQRMEAACREAAPESRRSFGLALAFGHAFERFRAEADMAPALRESLRASIQEAVKFATPTPTSTSAAPPRPPSISIQIHAPASAMSAGTVFGALGGALAIGVLVGWLLHPLAATEPAPVKAFPSASSHTLAVDAPPTMLGETTSATLRTVTDEGPHRRLEAPRHAASEHARGRPTGAPRSRPVDPFELLDQARAAVDKDDALKALAALAQHARRVARGPGVAERQHLLILACGLAAARGEDACAGLPPEPLTP
jgi:DNA-directed RNA polymerase specialized sigma24 family protein